MNPTTLLSPYYRHLIIVWLLCTTAFYSQSASPYIVRSSDNFVITNWQTEQGLPQNSIQTIAQTNDGHMWFGTQHGLVRFDGITFTKFGNLKSTKLSYNNIFTIAASSTGDLWVGIPGAGVFKFNGKNFIRLLLSNDSLDEKPGKLFTGTNNDLFIEDALGLHLVRENKSIHLKADDGTDLRSLGIQCEIASGKYLLTGSPGKTYLLDGNALSLFPFPSAPGGYNRVIHKTSSGYLLINTDGVFTYQNGKILPILYSGKPIRNAQNAFTDKFGGIWIISSGEGVYYFNGITTSVFNQKNGLSHNLVYTGFCDNENNVWIGTLPAGINKISRNFIKTISAENGLENEFIFSIAQSPEGKLLLGTYGGGVLTAENAMQLKTGQFPGITPRVIRTVFSDNDGAVWAGGINTGLYRSKNGKVTVFTSKEGLPSNSVYAIFRDSKGILWIGTDKGISSFGAEKFISYKESKELTSRFIRSISEDNAGNIWFGTDGKGLFVLQNGKFIDISANSDIISKAFIRSIYCDKEGTLWFCTGAGLASYNNSGFFSYSEVEGITGEAFYNLLEDDFGRFYIGSNHGIYVVSKNELKQYAQGKIGFINAGIVDKTDGMLSSECNGGNQPSAIKGKDNKLYFPTLKGVAVINPVEFGSVQKPIPLHIEKVFLDDSEADFSDTLIIPAGTGRVELLYSALTFTNPGKVTFRYLLEKYDKKFNAAGNNRTVIYSKLPPGEYNFILTASSGYGLTEATRLKLVVIVKPFFYQTTLFLVLCFIFIAGAIPGVYFLRIRSYKQQQEELTRIVEERTLSLREEKEKTENALKESDKAKIELAQLNIDLQKLNKQKTDLLDIAAHDLKNPLNAIKGFSQVLVEENTWHEDSPGIAKTIYSAATSMLRLIDDILQTSRLEQADIKLKLKRFSPCKAIQTVKEHNEINLSNKEQTLTIQCDPILEIVTDYDKLVEILDNLISNAIKYSHRGKEITIGAQLKGNDSVLFFVRDQGLGMTEEDIRSAFGKFTKLSARPTENESSTGLGLSIVKSIIDSMGGEIWIESEPQKGSTFYFILPNGLFTK